MKAHKYWSIGALITMIGTFYTGYKGSKLGHRYFACSTLICMIMSMYCLLYTSLGVLSFLLFEIDFPSTVICT